MTASLSIEVVVEDARWAPALGDPAAFAEACRRAAARLEPRLNDGAVALLLADDQALRRLNRRFRGKDAPTNVLSFPAARHGAAHLGDIAAAFETCDREARAAGVAFEDRAAHLIVHGLLHLVGHDHVRDDEAERMERLETEILAAMGIADPYGSERR
jgi:probable rRNA maturation factor